MVAAPQHMKVAKRLADLKRLSEHPSTNPNERKVARRMFCELVMKAKEKYGYMYPHIHAEVIKILMDTKADQ